MNEILLINVLFSFFLAGGWIAFATLFAEKFGSKIGGSISNLPSNILISFIFVSFVNDVNYVSEAAMAVPAGLIATTVFMLFFVALLRFGLAVASVVSIILWFGAAFLIERSGLEKSLMLSSIIYFAVVIICMLIIEKVFKVGCVEIEKRKYSIVQMIGRAVFAGSIVALVVVLSKSVPPNFTGVLAAFPAMIFSTLFILAKNQGPKFAKATGKVLVLTTSNIWVYSLAVHYFYPGFGVLWGTIFSYFVAAIWVVLLFPIIKKMA